MRGAPRRLRAAPRLRGAPRWLSFSRGPGAWITATFGVAGLVALVLLVSESFAAQPTVGLGTADSYAVLAGSTVTNTGPSTINGDLGLSPGTAVTGFPPGTVNGTINAANAAAGQAQSDLAAAYFDAASRTPALSVSGDLGGLTLTPGVYKAQSSLGLTGTLTLDAQGNANAVFVFQVGSALTTATGSHVNLINGAQACNVFWQIGSSATLGASSVFTGNILALTSISIDDSATVAGRALARNGAVTLIDDTISAAHCATTPGTTTTGTTPSGTTPTGTAPTGTSPSGTTPPGTAPKHGNGTALLAATPRSIARKIGKFGTSRCLHETFHASVTGLFIRRVVFSQGGHVIATRNKAPFGVLVGHGHGIRTVTARVTFTDGTPAATLKLRFKSCAAAKLPVAQKRPAPSRPPSGRSGFTG